LIRAELRPGNVHGLRDYLRNVIPEGKIIIKTLKKILSKFLPLAGSRTRSLLCSLISHTTSNIFHAIPFKKSEMMKI
jgi:hypothetical protein